MKSKQRKKKEHKLKIKQKKDDILLLEKTRNRQSGKGI